MVAYLTYCQLNGLNAATSSGAMKSRTAPPQHRTNIPRAMAIHSVADVLLRPPDRMDGVWRPIAAPGNPYAGPCGDYRNFFTVGRNCASQHADGGRVYVGVSGLDPARDIGTIRDRYEQRESVETSSVNMRTALRAMRRPAMTIEVVDRR